jgi:acyl-CoA dehydrogenase
MTLPALSVDDLPMFFGPEHVELAPRLRAAAAAIAASEQAPDEAARDRAAVDAMAAAGVLAQALPGAGGALSARALVLCRELLGYVSPRADSIFAVQGLGTFAALQGGHAGASALRAGLASGQHVAAFALTEPDAGSDVAAIATRAVPDGPGFVLDGDKLFISNLGLATHATIVCSVDPAAGRRGQAAFWIPLDAPGVHIEPLTATAPHPIGALHLRGVRLPASALIGAVGDGFAIAMATLDAFRVSVGAAAVGMARRALDEAVAHVRSRHQFGKALAEQQLVQAHLADMAVDLDAARLLVLRAAWQRDVVGGKVTLPVSIAKLGATEAASRIIDRAVQLLGGRGVMLGHPVELLYRAIRPLRIYEGTSEIQRTIIGRAIAGAGASR